MNQTNQPHALPPGGMRLVFAMQKHSDKQDAPFSRPCGATENDAQKLHARRLLPVIVVRNIAHEVLCLYRHEDRMRDAYMRPLQSMIVSPL